MGIEFDTFLSAVPFPILQKNTYHLNKITVLLQAKNSLLLSLCVFMHI